MTGAWLLRRVSAHKMVGLYAVLNVVACLLVFCKLGWLSVVCVFVSYFFMSIMFPTIFALGIFGLGNRAKGASAYIVMAIVGGALLPKLMGAIADHYDMSRGFIVPLVCFRADRPLRLHVAQAEPRGIVARGGHVRRALAGAKTLLGFISTRRISATEWSMCRTTEARRTLRTQAPHEMRSALQVDVNKNFAVHY